MAFDWIKANELLSRWTTDTDHRHEALLYAHDHWSEAWENNLPGLCWQALRRVRSRDRERMRPEPNTAAVELAVGPRLDDRLDWQEFRGGLPDRDRLIIDLLMERYSQTEIADRVGIHKGNITRAVQRIGAAWQSYVA